MRHNWYSQLAPARQIKYCKQKPAYHILDLPNRTLIEVAEAEQYARQNETYRPRCSGSSEEVGYAVHQITPVNEFFPECRKGPGESQSYQQHFGIPDKWAEVGKIGPSVEEVNQKRLCYEQFEQLICKAKRHSQC